jgi:hypothetical protein
MLIVVLLSVTAWITAIQRIVFVYHATKDLPLEQVEAMPKMARYTPDQSQVQIPGTDKRGRKSVGEVTPR